MVAVREKKRYFDTRAAVSHKTQNRLIETGRPWGLRADMQRSGTVFSVFDGKVFLACCIDTYGLFDRGRPPGKCGRGTEVFSGKRHGNNQQDPGEAAGQIGVPFFSFPVLLYRHFVLRWKFMHRCSQLPAPAAEVCIRRALFVDYRTGFRSKVAAPSRREPPCMRIGPSGTAGAIVFKNADRHGD